MVIRAASGKKWWAALFLVINHPNCIYITYSFSFEIEITNSGTLDTWWGVFIYASVEENIRRVQWTEA